MIFLDDTTVAQSAQHMEKDSGSTVVCVRKFPIGSNN